MEQITLKIDKDNLYNLKKYMAISLQMMENEAESIGELAGNARMHIELKSIAEDLDEKADKYRELISAGQELNRQILNILLSQEDSVNTEGRKRGC